MYKKMLITFLGCLGILSSISYAETAKDLIIVGGDSGTVLTSPDGIHWALQKTNVQSSITSIVRRDDQADPYTALAYANQNESLVSADAINWNIKSSASAWYPNAGLIWDTAKKQFLALDNSKSEIFTSFDGWNWTAQYQGVPNELDSIAVSPTTKTYVAVGGMIMNDSCSGWVVTSSDGLKWKKLNQDLPCIAGVTWAGNQFIASGQKGGYDQKFESGMLTSPDGQAWTWHNIPAAQSKPIGNIVWGNNRYVAIGTDDKTHNYVNLAYTSPDGINWAVHSSLPAGFILKTAFVNNLFIAVGENGMIITSADGERWVKQNTSTSAWLRSIAIPY